MASESSWWEVRGIEAPCIVKRILIVDDLLTERTLAGRLLSRESDWILSYATNGRDALRQIELQPPDLILTDLHMPELNGLELVSAVRERYPTIPVILMTAAGNEEIAVKALRSGAASYVPKRVLAQQLVDVTAQVFATLEEQSDELRLTASLSELGYVLENDSRLTVALVSRLRQVVRDLRLCDETDSLRLATALNEALENAHYHGNLEVSSELREDGLSSYFDLARLRRTQPPYRDRHIHVHAVFSGEQAEFVIRDEGPGFDLARIPDPTDFSFLERPYGRGILLMRTFVDEIRFNERGNEVRLVKRRTVQ